MTENKTLTITLAHINDTHSYFEPTSYQFRIEVENQVYSPFVSVGGFARLASRAQQLKANALAKNQGFLFLHAGDCFQGTLYFSLFKGKANAELLNALSIDAMALGNHELDMGNDPVGQFVRQINFPLLAGNWDLSNEYKDKLNPLRNLNNIYSFDDETRSAKYIVRDIDGERIAIFGLSLDLMADIANPDIDTPFVNALETARNTIDKIHQEGINKIILLSHLGYEGDLRLAGEVQGISVIVGGHSHVLQGDFSKLGVTSRDVYGVRVNQTVVVQAGYHALTLGHCELTFDEHGIVQQCEGKNEILIGRRFFVDASLSETVEDHIRRNVLATIHNHGNVVVCKKDPYIQSIIQNKYQPKVRQLQAQQVAFLTSPARHIRIPDEQGGSVIAPLVAKSFYYAMANRGYAPDFAIHNAGGVRNSLNAGQVSLADIAGKILPFAVPIGVYKIQGHHIATILEGAINNAISNGVAGTGSGSYPYCYHLDFKYDRHAPLGSRILNLKIMGEFGWEFVVSHRVYTGTSSAYTMKGKEGYDAILNMQDAGEVTALSMADCFIEFLADNPKTFEQSATYENAMLIP
ncbi:bifunctional metallophosphatase/5'-nucleotidase [Vibrio sp. ZSDZ34]|uniref:Bifunctional metallophosphatase/5'-nucleotidase n=2 Tax=Vibrio gelatinilyticus TaxID=2893468 RepID=A0A9X2AWC1_9VIBR|nr:bifunctional UDP-sugar hydrolase/5'-nucleotidase [Vibrio gelatinilyticus]MCJ2377096.1 bifunctional metallophosphatase/5'-nucleotidase [Vibrio gelatinilyticus]